VNPIMLLLTCRSAVGRLSFHLAPDGLPLNRTGAPVKQPRVRMSCMVPLSGGSGATLVFDTEAVYYFACASGRRPAVDAAV
jgi:hypothetical protein